MSKKMNSLLAVSLVAGMLLSSCGGSTASSSSEGSSGGKTSETKPASSSVAESSTDNSKVTPAGQLPIVNEPMEVTLAIKKYGQVEDYIDNSYTKFLEEQTGLTLNLEIYPENEANQKMEVLIASGAKLPDAFSSDSFFGSNKPATVFRHAQNGIFIELDDLIEEYGVNLKEMVGKVSNDKFMEMITSPDGHIYCLPVYNEQTSNQHSLRAYINQVWLDNLNLEMPTTTEELRDVLRAFKTQDPNGNGMPDEIAMMGGGSWHQMADDWLMNAFIYDDGETRWMVNDGKLDVPYNKEEWREGLRYLNELVSEGLFDPLTFTQDGASFKSIATSGDTNCLGVVCTAGMGQLFSASMSDRKSEYAPLDPVKGPEGVQWAAFYPTNPSPGFAITKDCENPEVLFRLADFMMSEEVSVFSRFGEKGVDWVEPEAGDVALGAAWGAEPAIKTILVWGGSSHKSHWNDVAPHILLKKYTDGQVWNGDPTDAEYMIAISTATMLDKTPDEAVTTIIYTEEENEVVADIKTTIETYVNESMARFATGDMDLDKDWDSYLKELDNMGLEKYISISQTAYDRMQG